ncbi:MAG: Putative Cytochrome-b5 reductase [Nitrospira sp.]|nr:MAG: Putative Cytochrome-b5 reductase [Nitrospira sp.]
MALPTSLAVQLGLEEDIMNAASVTRLRSKQPVPYELVAIHRDTHDTKTFRFALPSDATLDLLPGDHLYVHATIDGKPVKRPYTPSSLPGITGSFDLTVKQYETGTISRYLHDRQVGETVLMSGPSSGGHWVDGMAKKVGFVAGGSGITPMIAIMRWVLARNLNVDLFLLYANKTEADIIFRAEWDAYQRAHANFHCYYVLSQPPADWSQGVGRVSEAMLRAHLPAPGAETAIFLCGPPPMVDEIEATLHTIGYAQQAIVLP